jgi:poly [ADP-ribose] polymerase
MAGKVAKLRMITTENNNKFYYMTENGSNFDVEYGREGANPQKTSYPMSKWTSTYNSKVKKGYKDYTDLFIVESETTTVDPVTKTVTKSVKEFLTTRTQSVIDLVKKLQGWAKGSIEQNYNVTSENVTQKQVDKAQSLLDDMVAFDLTKSNINAFNNLLLEFFGIVPRKMKQVKSHLVNIDDDLTERKNKIISEEQSTLDVMAGQVKLNSAIKEEEIETPTVETDIIHASGLEIVEVTDKAVIEQIKTMMADNKGKFKQAFEVVNNKTKSMFGAQFDNAKNKKTELFWHGSRNENWWSIMTTGLLIRPSNAVYSGSMFGDGIYFADKFQKSYGYTSGRGSYWAGGSANEAVLALYDVHVGEQKHIKKHDSSCYKLSASVLEKDGFDSVFAHGGADLRNNEYITYKSGQSTIKYLVIVNA